MIRSPPKLRSGPKGNAILLSTRPADKTPDKKLLRSLSVPSASPPNKQTTMPGSAKALDHAAVEQCVNSYLTSEDVVSRLVSRLAQEIKTVVEAAVHTALTAVNQEVEQLRGEVAALTARLRELDDTLAVRTDDLEQYQRRNNLRVFGVEETPNEDTDKIILELCRDKLGIELPEHVVCRSHRVGKPPAQAADGGRRHRAIIVRFVSYRDRQSVYSAKKMLKGTRVTIREDLTARRMEVYRQAAEKYGVRSTWTQDGRVLWINQQGQRGVATHLSHLDGPDE